MWHNDRINLTTFTHPSYINTTHFLFFFLPLGRVKRRNSNEPNRRNANEKNLCPSSLAVDSAYGLKIKLFGKENKIQNTSIIRWQERSTIFLTTELFVRADFIKAAFTWQTRVGKLSQVSVCERRINSRQTRTNCCQQITQLTFILANFFTKFSVFVNSYSTCELRVNDWKTCVGNCQPIKTRALFTWLTWGSWHLLWEALKRACPTR